MFKKLAIACSAAALSLGFAAGAQADEATTQATTDAYMGRLVIIDVVTEEDCMQAVDDFRGEVQDSPGSAEALIEADRAQDACAAGDFREASNHLTDAYQDHWDNRNAGDAAGGSQ